jgi:hypothetical protein
MPADPADVNTCRVNVYVVFSYGDPMPITSCETSELAEQYAEALGRLPQNHPLYTPNACVDELPLIAELPEPLRDPERQEWIEEARPQTYGA